MAMILNVEHVHTNYQISLVCLSFSVAILSSFVALDMVNSLTLAVGRIKLLWLIAGAFAMGCGIWSMHFIGMLAFQMPGMEMGYDIDLMLLSIVIAVGASGFALHIMSRGSVSRPALSASATAMAAAIAGMHYVGMYSMRMDAVIEWNPWMIALSLAIALVASFSAFIVASRLPTAEHPFRVQIVASILLGIAIAGMHYAGMEAAEFHHAEIEIDPRQSLLATSELTYLVVGATFTILILALTSSVIDRFLTRRVLREKSHARKAHEAEVASALKTRFLANMSHEIRTPLGAIIGFTELMLEETLDEKQRVKHLQTVLRSGRALLQIVDDVLDLSKIEMDRLELERRDFEIRPFLEDIVGMLHIKAEAKGLTLSLGVDAAMPLMVNADSTRLRQILVNIIGNAIKFTKAGRVHVAAKFENQHGVDLLKFEIEDSGVGITPDQAAKLFQPFTQADSSTTRLYGGTGLGLDISRRLAKAMGGSVEIANSATDRGTTFVVTIVGNASEVPPKPKSNPSSPIPAMSLAGMDILLVDDNEDNQTLISRILIGRGAKVTSAANGLLGVQTAQTHSYDAILMDIQMPVMNGYQAITKLRALGMDTPIIALTANALKEEREACFACGCTAYLTKPVDVRQLVAQLSASVNSI